MTTALTAATTTLTAGAASSTNTTSPAATMKSQTACHVLMVMPCTFGFNAETATTNAFQQAPPLIDNKKKEESTSMQTTTTTTTTATTALTMAKIAADETRAWLNLLQRNDVGVVVVHESEAQSPASVWQPLPDAVFPNNVFTFHHDGTIGIHAMCHMSRRREQMVLSAEVWKALRYHDFEVDTHKMIRWCDKLEPTDKFCEGTGSLVFDHVKKIVYACISPRTHPEAVKSIADSLGYQCLCVDAVDPVSKRTIYHTNVMLSVGDTFAVCCAESITDMGQRETLLKSLRMSGKDVIVMSSAQMNEYACNVLQLSNKDRTKTFLAMSDAAFSAWTTEQKQRITDKHKCAILHAPIPTIERYGGGSVRCMLAEVFLPRAWTATPSK